MNTSNFGRSGSGRTSGGRPPFRGGYRGASPARFTHTPSRGTRFGPPRKNFRGGRGGNFGAQRIDISKFINKAVITEKTEHFVPEHNFADFAIDSRLKQNIIAKGYTMPTPIQDRTIPHILRGSDVVGIANTGTGKTAAFLIPLINKTLLDPKSRTLIVVPTRELAIQIDQEFRGFARNLRLFSACCVGGAGIGQQISALRHMNHFVIGTPGRLKDLMERKILNLAGFNSAVLDEADRMLDMGFVNDMRFMLTRMPAHRQTLFFSATTSREIDGLIKEFLKAPVTISVKTRETAQGVEQDVVRVGGGADKLDALHKLLAAPDFTKVLIFGRTKHGVEKLSKALLARGVRAESIHGNKPHGKRQRALSLFKDNHLQVLVATDVAARGLDIADVSHVINYDIPATYEDYVHRIGRTGRGDKKGKALTFIE